MPLSELEGKRIAIMGFGAEGRAALTLLRKRLNDCQITVLEENENAADRIRAELASSDIEIRGGASAMQRLDAFDIIIKSPGISPYRPEICVAMERGVRFTSGTQLWCDEHAHGRLFIVTGTKGKSTTASLITHLLNAAGRHAELLGNIGKPALEAFALPASPEFWVMELSSYQATGLQCRAELALLLNLFPEHTDWHGSTDSYYRDKTEFLHDPGIRRVLVERKKTNLPPSIAGMKKLACYNEPEAIHVRGNAIFDGERKLLDAADVPLPGIHNLRNLCAALTAIGHLGIDIETVLPALSGFRGLPHRLYSLGRKNGIEYIDDSISTTPQSALAALQSFPGRPCTMLLGGYDRELDWTDFALNAGKADLHCAITLPDNGEKIANALRQANPNLRIIAADSMHEAVEAAAANTPEGGVVILSPGAPSYGHYRDFRERGQAFADSAGLQNQGISR